MIEQKTLYEQNKDDIYKWYAERHDLDIGELTPLDQWEALESWKIRTQFDSKITEWPVARLSGEVVVNHDSD